MATTIRGSDNFDTAPDGLGKVLQVVSGNFTTDTTMTSASVTQTGHSVTITPTSSTSKIYVMWASELSVIGDSWFHLYLYRDGAEINYPYSTAGNFGSSNQHGHGYSFNYLDAPATTSSVTYDIRAYVSGTLRYSSEGNSVATLTVMEIAQ